MTRIDASGWSNECVALFTKDATMPSGQRIWETIRTGAVGDRMLAPTHVRREAYDVASD